MSKKKGMWMGGVPPLGYDLPTDQTTRALIVNPADAERVQTVFKLYLALGSVSAVEQHLNAEGWKTRERISRRGVQSGGVPYSRGMLFHLLKNRIYRGEIVHGDNVSPGLHAPIIAADLFEAVQRQLAEHAAKRAARPLRSADLPLKGRLFDADGYAMSPTFGYGRGGKVYLYYVSAPLQLGRKHQVDRTQAIRRITAETIHEVVCRALEARILDRAPPQANSRTGVWDGRAAKTR